MRSPARTAFPLLPAWLLAMALSTGAGVALERPLYAYPRGGPHRWEAAEPQPQPRKPYRPLHLPPETLPPAHQPGLLGSRLTAEEHAIEGLATVLFLSVSAQWLAVWARVPAALLLLLFGCVAGPVTEFLDPDQLFGGLLLPLVSMVLALVLFFEGLTVRTLRWGHRGGVDGLASVGLAITWGLGAIAAWLLLQLSVPLALLFGLILALTGPAGALASARRRSVKELDAIITGERIITDLAGTALVILIFRAVLPGGWRGFGGSAWTLARNTLGFPAFFGACGGGVLITLLRRQWVPRSLEHAVPPMLALAVFAVSNLVQADSGFLAVMIMGVLASYQETVTVGYAKRLQGRWHDLLLAAAFLVLVARVRVEDLLSIGVAGAVFVAVMVLSTRSLAVGLSTWSAEFGWRERLLLSLMAPRGVLAAGLATICGLRLDQARHPEAAVWVPLTLLVVGGTMAACALVPLVVRRSQTPVTASTEPASQVT